MKYIVRSFLFSVFALWLTSEIFPALVINDGWQLILLAGLVLALLMIIVRPILKILFIPINILTFGLMSWVINVIVIYILTIVVPEVRIQPWTFPGFSFYGFVVPAIHLSYPVAMVITSLMVTFLSNILHNVSEG
jgi:putative membrane protein